MGLTIEKKNIKIGNKKLILIMVDVVLIYYKWGRSTYEFTYDVWKSPLVPFLCEWIML